MHFCYCVYLLSLHRVESFCFIFIFISFLLGLITNPNASSVGAGILLGLILVYFVLENFVLEKYLRYIFTIYPVLIFAFFGVIDKLVKTGGSRQNITFGSVNMSICVALFITRIALSIYRFKQRQSVSNSRNEKEKFLIDQI